MVDVGIANRLNGLQDLLGTNHEYALKIIYF